MSTPDEDTRATWRRCDFRYFIHQLGHIVWGNLCLHGNYRLNIRQQAICPRTVEKVWWYWQAGESQKVEEELSQSPVTHLLMHQELVDVLLLGEWQMSNQFCFNSPITACGRGFGYDILHLRCIFVVKLWDDVVKLCCILHDVWESKLTLKLRNHMADFSGQKGGTQIPTQLIVKIKSGGCSDHVDGSSSCCMMRLREEYCTNSQHYMVFYSRGYQCGGIDVNYQTHTIHTHTHNRMCTRCYFPAYVECLQPTTCLLLSRIASHTDTTSQFALHTQLCRSVYMIAVYGR